MPINNEDLKLSDRLAIDRTAMGADRTLMAWTRTAMSMIGFGFTIYKVLQGALKEGVMLTLQPEGPRRMGLFLIAIGTVSLVLGMIEHWHTKKQLGVKPRFKVFNPSFLTSSAVLLLGAFLFLTIILRREFF